LIPVLWAMALLTFVAFLMTRNALLDTRFATNLTGNAQARELADGLAQITALQLAALQTQSRSLPASQGNGAPVNCRIGEAVASIVVQEAAGQINLNLAARPMLEQLLRGIGLANAEAFRLAGAIVDFRDADDAPVEGGAETAAYGLAGLTHGPKNAPFESVGELEQVLGVTPEIYARLRPLVTVYSSVGGIDSRVASDAVMSAITGGAFVPGESVRDPSALASAAGIPSDFFFLGARTRGSPRAPLPVYSITVDVRMNGAGWYTRHAVVQPASGGEAAPKFLEWDRIQPGNRPVATFQLADCLSLISNWR